MANTDTFMVPGYRTERRIGAGGMSEVYLVRDNLERLYALKALAPSLQQDPGFRKRFRSEAQIMASLTHPNIVQLHSYIEDEPRYCLVMEYMSGGSLKDILRSTGPIIESRALGYLKQIASGMAYAHAKGIIHRDIKPANILVSGDGTMKITDFGIARISDSEGYTKTGTPMGTVVYMSPEQIADSKHVTTSTDVFSLGVTFWEMLTGIAPYNIRKDNEFQIFENIVHRDLPDPRKYNHNISNTTLRLLKRMTQRDIGKRITIIEVVNALEMQSMDNDSGSSIISGYSNGEQHASTELPTLFYLITNGALTFVKFFALALFQMPIWLFLPLFFIDVACYMIILCLEDITSQKKLHRTKKFLNMVMLMNILLLSVVSVTIKLVPV